MTTKRDAGRPQKAASGGQPQPEAGGDGPGPSTTDPYGTARNLFDLIERLDRGGRASVNSIVKDYDVSPGTAKRYLAFVKKRRGLREILQGQEKFWMLAAGAPKMRPFDFAAALELATRSAQWLTATPYHRLLEEELQAQRSCVDPGAQDRLQTFVTSFAHRTQGDASYANKQSLLEKLLRAIREHRPCEITYQRHDGEVMGYRVEPLLLTLYKDHLYVLGRKAPEQNRRTFILDSIREVKIDADSPPFSIGDRRFTDLSKVFGSSFGIFTDCGPAVDVDLHVRGAAAMTFRRRRLHPTQEIEDLGDGWLRVRLHVAVCPELRAFVQSLLPDVRVQAPPDLRRDVVAAARAIVDASAT